MLLVLLFPIMTLYMSADIIVVPWMHTLCKFHLTVKADTILYLLRVKKLSLNIDIEKTYFSNYSFRMTSSETALMYIT